MGKLRVSPVEALCEAFVHKANIEAIEPNFEDDTKVKQYAIRLLKSRPIKNVGLPDALWKIIEKHRILVSKPPLTERSPMRSPKRCQDQHQPYSLFPRNNIQVLHPPEAENTFLEAQAEALVAELKDEKYFDYFKSYCEKLSQHWDAEDGTVAYLKTNSISAQPHNSPQVINRSYQNYVNNVTNQEQAWASARFEVQNGAPRTPHYSFSSGSSTASSASPGPALSSAPSSPASPGSYLSYPYGPSPADNTAAWITTTSPNDLSAYTNLPVPLSELQVAESFTSSPATSEDGSVSPPISRHPYPPMVQSPPLSYSSPMNITTSPESCHEEAPVSVRSQVVGSSWPPKPNRDRFVASLAPDKVKEAWAAISKLSLEKLSAGDEEGDTQLMILLANRRNFAEHREYLYHIVERILKEWPKALAMCNRQTIDALHLAVFDCPDDPLIAAYLAEAYLRGGLQFKIYEGGETLIHVLVRRGDVYSNVLNELLAVRAPDGSPAFDVNLFNTRGLTPLHIACACHRPGAMSSSELIQSLLTAGADMLSQEYLNKNTPLHIMVENSGDLRMVELFRSHLAAAGALQLAAEAANRQNNTVLHMACARNSLPLTDQKALVEALLSFGGRIHVKNHKGCVPSFLVDPSRKEEIRELLHGKASSYQSELLESSGGKSPEGEISPSASPLPSFAAVA